MPAAHQRTSKHMQQGASRGTEVQVKVAAVMQIHADTACARRTWAYEALSRDALLPGSCCFSSQACGRHVAAAALSALVARDATSRESCVA